MALRRPPESATGAARHAGGRKDSPVLVRYADDFAVCCHYQAAGRERTGQAAGMAGRAGPVPERGQDANRPPHSGFRLPRLELPPLPQRQAADQAVQGGRQEAPATARGRDAQAARIATRGRSSPRSTPSSGAGRPTTGAWSPARYSPRWRHYMWKLTYKWARRTRTRTRRPRWVTSRYFGKFCPYQERQVGLRRPGHRRLPAQALLDEHPAARHGQGHGHPPTTRTWPDTGRTGGASTAPRSTRAPSACSAGRTTAARYAGTGSSTPATCPPPPRNGNTGGSSVTRQDIQPRTQRGRNHPAAGNARTTSP